MAEDMVPLLEKAAKLSRVSMSPSELAELAQKAQVIFAAFRKLSELDTRGVEPLYTFRDEIELRADDAFATIVTEKLLSIAPESESGHYVVPRAVGGEDVI